MLVGDALRVVRANPASPAAPLPASVATMAPSPRRPDGDALAAPLRATAGPSRAALDVLYPPAFTVLRDGGVGDALRVVREDRPNGVAGSRRAA